MSVLSVVLVAAEDRGRGSAALSALARQTLIDDLEVIVVDRRPSLAPLSPAPALAYEVIPAPGRNFTQARIIGARRASSPIVAFVEDHAYVSPEWAAALVKAYSSRSVAISYSFFNANPETYVARAGMVAEYGFWEDSRFSGPSTSLPSHNISYKRERLLALGDALETLMTPDQVLIEYFAKRGEPMAIEGSARVAHENCTTISRLLQTGFLFGRMHAAHRAIVFKWSISERVAKAIVAPTLGPVLGLARLSMKMRKNPGGARRLVEALPVVIASYTATGLGASVGYLLGSGSRTVERFNSLEAFR